MKGCATAGFKMKSGIVKIRGNISERNLRRLAMKNKDVVNVRDTKQLDKKG